MNAIRCTTYAPTSSGTPDSYKPFTIVLMEKDLRDDVPLDEAALSSVDLADQEGIFAVTQTFDINEEASIEEATIEAIRIMQVTEQTERMMACMYQYEAAGFSVIKSGGTLMGTIPAPMTYLDCQGVMHRLARHPAYANHTVIMPTTDGYITKLASGEVSSEKIA